MKNRPPSHVVKVLAVRAKQSPLNPLQWCLSLMCGHECWITQKTRPKVPQQIICGKCTRQQTEREKP